MPGNQQTPDQIKENVEILGNVGSDGTYFDTTAFARVTEVRFGNVGRNTMRGPGVANLDLGLFRSFKVRESDLQFRLEAFNATNTPHFANPNGNVNSCELRARAVHADRGCDGPVAAVPRRRAHDVLDQLMV